MACDIFLKVPEIEGEATDDGYEKQIECLAFSHGVEIPTKYGKATGEVQHQPLSVTKKCDKASPVLNEKCGLGKPVGTVELSCLRAGGDKTTPYFLVRLGNAIIASVDIGGAGGDFATETVTFSYDNIEWEYTADEGSNTPASWDLTKNTPKN